MNHYVATQPPHLNGRWQYAVLTSRGGGPICGCVLEDGHDTREDAERHLYETALANMVPPHQWREPEQLLRCEQCAEWTDVRVGVQVHHFASPGARVLCEVCAAPFFDELRWSDAVRELVPFRPGVESWGTL